MLLGGDHSSLRGKSMMKLLSSNEFYYGKKSKGMIQEFRNS
ncbi:hypothetical protein (plasmid) [Metabacillus dongyingensis]|nr:hypothetical protein [Metabacillus dongyingensis]